MNSMASAAVMGGAIAWLMASRISSGVVIAVAAHSTLRGRVCQWASKGAEGLTEQSLIRSLTKAWPGGARQGPAWRGQARHGRAWRGTGAGSNPGSVI